jgi:hypothetical protein
MNSDLQKVLVSKSAHRRKLDDLPIGEKVSLPEAMRERTISNCNATPKDLPKQP